MRTNYERRKNLELFDGVFRQTNDVFVLDDGAFGDEVGAEGAKALKRVQNFFLR